MVRTSSDQGKQPEPEDGREKWERPALQRLNAKLADASQKKSDDGVMGKGLS